MDKGVEAVHGKNLKGGKEGSAREGMLRGGDGSEV